METGVAPAAYACAALDDGRVVYGGSMTLAGSTEVEHIAMWDGSSWSPVGTGVDNFVRTIVALPGSQFIAGGHFTQAGGHPAGLIARWNGSEWSAFGQGLDGGSCRAIMVTQLGHVIAAGSFVQADSLEAWHIARWDGLAWHKVGVNTAGGGVSGNFGPEPRPTMILDVVEMSNRDIIVGGDFIFADGVSARGVARWDGEQWYPLGSGTSSVVRALEVLPNGDLIAAGLFTQAGGVPCNGLARWNGSEWHAIGDGLNGINGASPFALALTPNGHVVLAGYFDAVDSVPVNSVAIWDPVADVWSAMGSGMSPAIQTSVFDLAVDSRGIVYAGGQFASAGGTTAARNAASFDCLQTCAADFNGDGELNFFDAQEFLAAFAAHAISGDWNHDGLFDFFDVQAFLNDYAAGCP